MSDNPAPSKIIPNTFQTPNILTDDGLMALLTGPETKCYIVVIRKTFGWRKDRDRIAKSQIMAMSGLGEDAADEAMNGLQKYGLVVKVSENNAANAGNEWAPQMDERLIDYAGLQARETKKKDINAKRTEKARLTRGGGVVGQPHPVGQPGGGVVGHPPQQPIKTNVLVVVKSGDVSKSYEKEFGALTPMIADAIDDACKTYPIEWIPEAMEIAVKANKRSWKYVEGILKNCKAKNIRPSLNRLEKTNGNHHTGNRQGAKQSRPTSTHNSEYSDADRAAAERVRKRNAERKLVPVS